MNEKQYLEDRHVKQFIEWLRRTMRNEPGYEFSHRYERLTKGKSKKTIPWSCSSIFDAFKNYEWQFDFKENSKTNKGSTYNESKVELDRFSKLLRAGVNSNDDDACHRVCSMILDWGGVLGSKKKGNLRTIDGMKPGLSAYLSASRKVFESKDIKLSRKYVTGDERMAAIKMNAGFTKIYSLLCKDFIIYDGRVGAALGLLVRNYCSAKGNVESVPDSLRFYYGSARNVALNRNPSNEKYIFRALSYSSPVHIRNNLKANWILNKALKENCGRFTKEADSLRKLECALFMIGYKI